MSGERDPELKKRWDAILAKRGLAVVGADLASGADLTSGDMVGAEQDAEYRLHEPGLTTNPTRAYVEGWIARQQMAEESRQPDRHQRSYWPVVASVVIGIIATGLAIMLLMM